MPTAPTPQGLSIAYETAGSPDDPPLLLINGFGAQLVSWPRGFCERLADGGRFVIAFDNRDCGLSSKLDGRGADLGTLGAAVAAGNLQEARRLAAYTLTDMAGDAFAVLDALGIEAAHIAGASMGGMIAQTMAIEQGDRLLSLTSIMSTTGEPEYGQSSPEALAALLTPSPPEREAYIDASERTAVWRSRRYPELDAARRVAAESYDRCFYPEGPRRHMAAIMASGPRADGLRTVRVPTLVIHGLDDTLIAPSGGERTAELVPGARLALIEDMGHDRPEPLWPQICGAMLEHTAADGG
jgi:pimeloyl-ACP methyl ester carboxylesterase